MQKKAAIITAAVLLAGTAFLYHMGCGISMFAKVTTSDGTGTHSEEDIRKAVSIAKKQFRNLNGCFMTEIHYSEEKTQQELDELHARGFTGLGSGFDDVIILESDFTTSKLFSSVPFNGVTQQDYEWIITHTEADGWQFRTAGYA